MKLGQESVIVCIIYIYFFCRVYKFWINLYLLWDILMLLIDTLLESLAYFNSYFMPLSLVMIVERKYEMMQKNVQLHTAI